MKRNVHPLGRVLGMVAVVMMVPGVLGAGTITVQNQSGLTIPETRVYKSCIFLIGSQKFQNLAPGQSQVQARTTPVSDACVFVQEVGIDQVSATCFGSTQGLVDPSDPETIIVTWTGSSPGDLACTVAIIDDQPPVPPAAPANLAAQTLSTARIRLTWSDQSNNETHFRIERKTEPSGPFGLVETPPAGTTAFEDAALSPATTYTYRVFAVNGAGEAVSNTATATTLASGGAPAAPSQFQAVATQGNGGTFIALAWHDNSGDETSFRLERRVGAGSFQQIAVLGADTFNTDDFAVSSGQTYGYRVRACNGSGCSAFSNEAVATAP
jgi:hypothetical protein